MTVLVDSDILIEITRGKNSAVLDRWRQLADSDAGLLCSPVNVAELWAGARPKEEAVLNALFDTFACAPIDENVGRQAGIYLKAFRASHGLEIGDALIAATAVVNRARLWTRNVKHYPMKDLAFY